MMPTILLARRMTEESRISARNKQLLEQISAFGYPDWVPKDFERITQDYIIKNTLKAANNETAKRTFLNRHGIEHGLTVSYYAGQLFWLIHNECIGSDYMIDYGLKKEEVLIVLLIAGYVHDCGRFYDREIRNHEERVAETLRHVHVAASNNWIFPESDGQKKELMLAKIAELCLCHDKKNKISGKVEIAMIKLADAFDCDQNRVYSAEDKPDTLGKFKDEDYPEFIKTILYNDEKPEKYFGPKSIRSVSLSPNETEGLVEGTVEIVDTAAYGELKDTVRILELCRKSQSKSARDFSNRVRIQVIDSKYTRPFPLYPKNPVFLPGACITRFGYDVDIVNMDGDSIVKTPLLIKNKSNSGGLSSHVAMLGGLVPIPWEQLERKDYYEVKKTFTNPEEVQEEELTKLDVKYLYSEKRGINHYYSVIFPRKVKKDETINILGVLKWQKLVDVFKDCSCHTVATPTQSLFFRIHFPKEIKVGAFCRSTFDITDNEGKMITTEKIHPEVVDGRVSLEKEIHGADSAGKIYGIRWEIRKA
jgi:metal-dependent HD superfamily phosphatase/phosphodiesterase